MDISQNSTETLKEKIKWCRQSLKKLENKIKQNNGFHEEISKIIRTAQRISENILNDNKDLLHSMAKSLLKFETIDAKDIKKILDGKKIIRRSNRKI